MVVSRLRVFAVTLDSVAAIEAGIGGPTLDAILAGEAIPCPTLTVDFEDLEGAEVVISDADGSIVATGRLELGDTFYRAPNLGCSLTFAASVPDSDFYRLQIGDRGSETVSREDLAANDGRVELELG